MTKEEILDLYKKGYSVEKIASNLDLKNKKKYVFDIIYNNEKPKWDKLKGELEWVLLKKRMLN